MHLFSFKDYLSIETILQDCKAFLDLWCPRLWFI